MKHLKCRAGPGEQCIFKQEIKRGENGPTETMHALQAQKEIKKEIKGKSRKIKKRKLDAKQYVDFRWRISEVSHYILNCLF